MFDPDNLVRIIKTTNWEPTEGWNQIRDEHLNLICSIAFVDHTIHHGPSTESTILINVKAYIDNNNFYQVWVTPDHIELVYAT